MTFYYDHERDELVGNNLVPYIDIEDGDLRINVGKIMHEGRGFSKLKEMSTAVTSAILRHARE